MQGFALSVLRTDGLGAMLRIAEEASPPRESCPSGTPWWPKGEPMAHPCFAWAATQPLGDSSSVLGCQGSDLQAFGLTVVADCLTGRLLRSQGFDGCWLGSLPATQAAEQTASQGCYAARD